MCEDYVMVGETKHTRRAPCGACGENQSNLISINNEPLICTARALTAARRAGAEEMREAVDSALRGMMATPPPDGCACGGCIYIGEARKMVADALRALHPDAKGGDQA